MSDAQPMQPRYRSIFWPLVLIAVGVLWLLGNFNVIAPVNLFALLRLWPVLLIAVGLDILVGRRWPLASALIALATVGLGVAAVVVAPQLGLAGDTRWGWFGPVSIGPGVAGSGTVVEQTREVSGFDAVDFSAVGDLEIRQGERESLVVTTDDNLLDYIKTEVRGNTLHIDLRQDGFPINFTPTDGIRYTLTVKDLNDIDHSGAGNLSLAGLKTEQLQAKLSGAGNLDLRGLDVERLEVRLSGAGNITAVGQAAEQDIRLSGFGEYRGGDLDSDSAEVSVSGAGSATVWARATLRANISGAGSIRYYGSPAVDENVSGLGSIDRAGDK